nr:MAG TPA: hypothetical protein [Caudoviricetes sp.]
MLATTSPYIPELAVLEFCKVVSESAVILIALSNISGSISSNVYKSSVIFTLL